MTYDVIGKARQAKELRVEYILIRELFVNLGRVLSIVAFIIGVTLFSAEKIIPILLAVFGIGYLFIHHFMKKVNLRAPHGQEVLVKEQLTDRSEEHTSELQSRGHLVC